MITSGLRKTSPIFWLILVLIITMACQLPIPATNNPDSPEATMPANQTDEEDTPTIASEEVAEEPLVSEVGPWLLLHASDSLWIQNADGSVVRKIFEGTILAPRDLNQGFARSTNRLALITGQEYSEMTLIILQLPEGTVVETIPLTSTENSSDENLEICDPAFEALRASTMALPVAWSPDETQLAFVGVLDGETSDVYLYDLANGLINRVSEEPGQAYELHWGSNQERITYFSASCFGTGAGFSEVEIGVVDLSTNQNEIVDQVDPDVSGLEFVAWVRSGADQMIVALTSGCPYRDLRILDLDKRSSSTIYEGCFDDYAVGPTGSVAIVVGRDFSDQPGVYLYAEPDIAGIPPVVFADETARAIRYLSSAWFVQTISQNNSLIYALDWSGNMLEDYQRTSFPVISKDESVKVWSENGKLILTIEDIAEPLELAQCEVNELFWYEAEGEDGELYQYLLYGCTTPERGLFLMRYPGYASFTVSGDLELVSSPILFFGD